MAITGIVEETKAGLRFRADGNPNEYLQLTQSSQEFGGKIEPMDLSPYNGKRISVKSPLGNISGDWIYMVEEITIIS